MGVLILTPFSWILRTRFLRSLAPGVRPSYQFLYGPDNWPRTIKGADQRVAILVHCFSEKF